MVLCQSLTSGSGSGTWISGLMISYLHLESCYHGVMSGCQGFWIIDILVMPRDFTAWRSQGYVFTAVLLNVTGVLLLFLLYVSSICQALLNPFSLFFPLYLWSVCHHAQFMFQPRKNWFATSSGGLMQIQNRWTMHLRVKSSWPSDILSRVKKLWTTWSSALWVV